MKVILFDGVCNLCNGSINWIIDHDKSNQFYFSALQSEYGKSAALKFTGMKDYMNTVILVEDEVPYFGSDAVLRILKHIGGVYSLGYIFIIIPRFIRNFFYNIVSRNRYRWFGKRDSCRVPTPGLKAKFIE